jgi:hypothetical protein
MPLNSVLLFPSMLGPPGQPLKELPQLPLATRITVSIWHRIHIYYPLREKTYPFE